MNPVAYTSRTARSSTAGAVDAAEGLINDPAVNAMLKAAVRDALLQGRTRMTVMLELGNRLSDSDASNAPSPTGDPQNNVRLDIATDLAGADVRFGVPHAADAPGMSGATRLVVTRALVNENQFDDVVFDLYDANGRLIDAAITNTDMRHMDAGTYYARIYRPDAPNSTGTPRNFTFSVMAPPAGQTRPTFENSDRDTLRGGEGNDFIVGNTDIDRLFGGTGTDVFTSDTLTVFTTTSQGRLISAEIRDYQGRWMPLVRTTRLSYKRPSPIRL